MLAATTEWTYVHPDHAATDYVLKVSGESLVIVSEVTEQVLASTPAIGIEKLTILGGAADDNLIVDLTDGNPIPTGGLVYDGGAQMTGDALELRNDNFDADPVDSIHYTFWNEHDGHIVLEDIGEVTFLGLEPIIDNLNAVDRVFDFTGGSEVIRVFDDAIDGNGQLTVDSNFAEEVTFPAPTNSLTLNMNDGPNILTIESLDSAFEVPQFNINGGNDVDQVFVQAAPANTMLDLNLLGGEDLVFVETTAAGGLTTIDTGADDDRVSISETNSATSSLDAILSNLVIEGGAHDESGFNEVLSVTIEGKETTVEGQIEVAVVEGDVLEIIDNGSVDAHNYVFAGNRLQRTSAPTGEIEFSGFETIDVVTGQNDDTVVISATTPETQSRIETGLGADTVRVLGTGDDSVLQVDLGEGVDNAVVSLIGSRAIARVNGDGGNDQLTLASSGFQSGVAMDGGAGNDMLEVQNTGNEAVTRLAGGVGQDQLDVLDSGSDAITEASGNAGEDELRLTTNGVRGGVALLGDGDADQITVAGTGEETLVRADGAAGGDVLNLLATGLNSTTELFGGADTDQINVSSDAPSNSGTLDGILGELCVDGGAHNEAPVLAELVSSSATAKQTTVARTAMAAVAEGDVLRIADQVAGPGDYVLTGNALLRGGDKAVDYADIELLEITSGTGDDIWLVGSTAAATHTTLVTAGGADSVTVLSTGNDSVLGVDTGAGTDSVMLTVTGTDSVVQFSTGSEADSVEINNTGLRSGLELETGAGQDVVTVVGGGEESAMRLDLGPAQDDLTVETTGLGSSTTVLGGLGVDLVRVDTTGATSGLLLDTGGDADFINVSTTGMDSVLEVHAGAGMDSIRVRGTGPGSFSDLFGGADSDTFDLFDGDFPAVATLEQMYGEICVFGEEESDAVEGMEVGVSAAVEVKDGAIALALNPTVTLFPGDVLNVLDRLATPASYVVTENTFQRVAAEARGLISHDGIEALNLGSGQGPDSWSLDAAPDVNSTTINTGDGDDQFELESASDDRHLAIDLGAGDDAARLDTTGDRSVTTITTGAGFDGVTVVSTGVASGLQIETGADEDLVVIEDTGASAAVNVSTGLGSDHLQITQSGEASVIQARLQDDRDSATVTSFGANAGIHVDLGQGNDAMQVMATGTGGGLVMVGAEGNDLLAVETTAADSLTDMFGGDGVDTFQIFAPDSTLGGIQGQICVDGGTHSGAPTETRELEAEVLVREDANDELRLTQDVMVSVELGDRLFMTDGSDSAGANYVLTAARLTRAVEGTSTVSIDFTEIEDLDFRTGAGADGVTISGAAPRTSILTRGGDDVIRVLAAPSDSLLTIDTGPGADFVTGSFDGQRSITTVLTQDGDDRVSLNGFGIGSGVEVQTGEGIDTILLASSPENGNLVVSSGPGADSVEVADTGVSSVFVLDAGQGDDAVSVNAVNSQTGLMIDAGPGVDHVRVESLNSDAGLKVFGGEEADTVSTTLDVLSSTMEFWGDADETQAKSGNRLDLFESLPTLDVADVPTDFVFQFDTLGLSAEVVTTVTVAPGSFDGFQTPFRLAGGDEDQLDLPEAWEFDTTGFVGDEFYNQLNADGTLLRITGFSPWQKPVAPLDINNNGVVDPLDALLLIGMLGEIGVLPTPTIGFAPDLVDHFHYDVNGDGALGPLDPLFVIRELPDTAESSARAALEVVFAELGEEDSE